MNATLRFVLLLSVVGMGQALSAELQISNRPPKPDEVGYRPADNSAVRLNPPSFIWLHEPAAHHYSIQWGRKSDFSHAVTATNLAFNTYTHNATLRPGTYFWRYRFTASNGVDSAWSQARKVIVPRDAVSFPMPT